MHAAAVGLALEALADRAVVNSSPVSTDAAEQLRPSRAARPPRRSCRWCSCCSAPWRRARPVGRGHKIDLRIDLLQRMLQYHHGEDGRAGGDVARARGRRRWWPSCRCPRRPPAGANGHALGQQALRGGPRRRRSACRPGSPAGSDLRQQIAQRARTCSAMQARRTFPAWPRS